MSKYKEFLDDPEFQALIEAEVRARMEFKGKEILTSFRNHINSYYRAAFRNNDQKAAHYQESLKIALGIINKELNMAPPYQDMAYQDWIATRDRTVKQIMGIIRPDQNRGRGRSHISVAQVVEVIESIMPPEPLRRT